MADEVKRTFDLTDADYERSIGIMVLHQKASASFLQRTMSLGYNAAASLMERAEKDGFVSRAANSGKRNVLIGLPEIAKLRADLANAGAVMVEAALRLPAYDSDGDPAGQFDHHVFVRRDELRALSTLIPDMAAAIAERDEQIERLTARAEAAEALLAAATGMVSIVEGMDGVMNHGVWRDDRGMRLKDTPEWVSLYNAHAAMREGR